MRIGFFWVDTIFLDGLGNLRNRKHAFVSQAAQRSQDHEMAIDLEVFAQFVAEIGTPEAVGAQYSERAPFRDKGTDLVAKCLDVVRGDDNWARRVFELLG